MTPKTPIVFSHQRSGTHFLLNAIALNFKRDHCWRDSGIINGIHRDKDDIILKSHTFAQCLEMTPTALSNQGFELFYIYRDPRDVLVSFWLMIGGSERARKRHFWDEDLEKFCFDYEPFDYPFDRHYGCFKTGNLVRHWKMHFEGWLRKKNVTMIAYEDLYDDFEGLIGGPIAKSLGEAPPRVPQRPSPHWNCVEARKGIPGDWRNHMRKGLSDRIEDEIGFLRRFMRS